MADTETAAIHENALDGQRVLIAGTVLTGRPDEVLHDAALALDGSKIAWIGTRAQLPEEFESWPTERFPQSTILPD